jgi:hypothetical protein
MMRPLPIALLLAYNCVGGFLVWHYLTLPLLSAAIKAVH